MPYGVYPSWRATRHGSDCCRVDCIGRMVTRFRLFFFFQAEDGIRDHCVTGVQTCALPILLLDEIAEVPQQTQVKLLRLLQEREFRPVGGSNLVRANFRLICSTNAPLDPQASKLREDLYFRINTITLEIPPLRDRPEDISLFCEHFLTKFARQHERPVQGIHSAARNALLRYSWPGNVRELEHVLERSVIVATGEEITLQDLPDIFQQPPRSPAPRDAL